ncbi:MAG TPA: beta-propeller fold lactonase family protein, partial [Chitinophagaceae bacterium]
MRKVYALLISGLAVIAGCLSSVPAPAQPVPAHHSRQYYLFIGTYAPADSNGIFVYRFNTATGNARLISAVSGIENPSFLNLSPDHRFVYAVSETHGGAGGQVYAYAFDHHSGRLIYLDQQLSRGDDPCNIITDHTGKWLFVANYSSGNFTEFPLEKNGSVGKAIQTIQHYGHGINPQRQEKPHVHCV